MNAQQLLRVYPRAWRERYGEEFIEVVGDGRLSAQQTIDIIAGAVDAWVSPSVRAGVRATATRSGSGVRTMIQQLKVKCATSTPRYTTRDALISAAVLLGATLVMSMAGIWASRSGHKDLGEFLTSLAFPASILISMPFAITKGQSRTSQTFFIAVPMAILVVLSYIAVKL